MFKSYTAVCKHYTDTQRLVIDRRIEIINEPNVDITIPNLHHTVKIVPDWLTDSPKIVIINT